MKQNREWGEEIGFKTEEEEKKGFSTHSETLYLLYKYPTSILPFPNPALSQLCQSPQPTTKQRSGNSGNVAVHLQKTYSFFFSVMAVWLHLFLVRKLELI